MFFQTKISNIPILLKKILTSVQIRNFIIAGFISAICDLLVLSILVEVYKFSVMISTTISVLVATLINYILSIKYVFTTGKLKRHHEFLAFYSLAGFGFVFSLSSMWLFYDILKIWYILSRLISIGINVLINFYVKKRLIFKN